MHRVHALYILRRIQSLSYYVCESTTRAYCAGANSGSPMKLVAALRLIQQRTFSANSNIAHVENAVHYIFARLPLNRMCPIRPALSVQVTSKYLAIKIFNTAPHIHLYMLVSCTHFNQHLVRSHQWATNQQESGSLLHICKSARTDNLVLKIVP